MITLKKREINTYNALTKGYFTYDLYVNRDLKVSAISERLTKVFYPNEKINYE